MESLLRGISRFRPPPLVLDFALTIMRHEACSNSSTKPVFVRFLSKVRSLYALLNTELDSCLLPLIPFLPRSFPNPLIRPNLFDPTRRYLSLSDTLKRTLSSHNRPHAFLFLRVELCFRLEIFPGLDNLGTSAADLSQCIVRESL